MQMLMRPPSTPNRRQTKLWCIPHRINLKWSSACSSVTELADDLSSTERSDTGEKQLSVSASCGNGAPSQKLHHVFSQPKLLSAQRLALRYCKSMLYGMLVNKQASQWKATSGKVNQTQLQGYKNSIPLQWSIFKIFDTNDCVRAKAAWTHLQHTCTAHLHKRSEHWLLLCRSGSFERSSCCPRAEWGRSWEDKD